MSDERAPADGPFLDLGIDPALARALVEEGYTRPTEIQVRAIPPALTGHDLLALAQTGTGKTAAFSLPILHRLHHARRKGPRRIRALILTPTRELALQVHESMRAYGRHLTLRATVILGGVSAVPQIAELRKTPDILVATPGRLLDLMSQGYVAIGDIETFVLDEADRMLDMGFIHDVRKIVAKIPQVRQTLFFSATMPKEVDALAKKLLRDPTRVEASPPADVPHQIEQKIFRVGRLQKRKLLAHLLKNTKGMNRVLIFARTKRRADTIVRHLKKLEVSVAAIHSNKTQGARQNALGGFSEGKVRVLVATDIVARGIDVDSISHVVNYDLPNEPESYVHRIGRTARAGAGGVAWSFCDGEEVPHLKQIERLIGRKLPIEREQPFHDDSKAAPDDAQEERPARGPAPSRGRGRRGGRGGDSERSRESSLGRSKAGRSKAGRSKAGRSRRAGPRDEGARPERTGEPRSERSGEHRSERSGEHRSERTGERSPERTGVPRSERSGERRSERSGRRSTERSGERRTEAKRGGRSAASDPGRPRDQDSTRSRTPRRHDPVDDNFSSGGLFGGKRMRASEGGGGDAPPRRPDPGESSGSRRRSRSGGEGGARSGGERSGGSRSRGPRAGGSGSRGSGSGGSGSGGSGSGGSGSGGSGSGRSGSGGRRRRRR